MQLGTVIVATGTNTRDENAGQPTRTRPSFVAVEAVEGASVWSRARQSCVIFAKTEGAAGNVSFKTKSRHCRQHAMATVAKNPPTLNTGRGKG